MYFIATYTPNDMPMKTYRQFTEKYQKGCQIWPSFRDPSGNFGIIGEHAPHVTDSNLYPQNLSCLKYLQEGTIYVIWRVVVTGTFSIERLNSDVAKFSDYANCIAEFLEIDHKTFLYVPYENEIPN